MGAEQGAARCSHRVRFAARAFSADGAWGIAALLWIGTGVMRVFMSLEKSTSYYLHNRVFYAKIGLFLLILLLEIRPMVTPGRWRSALRRGTSIDATPSLALARISQIEVAVVVLIVFVATALARA